jgi:RND family efflux transporter MFP subunit
METLAKKNKLSMVVFRFVRVVVILAVSIGLAYVLFLLKKEPEKNQVIQTPPVVSVIEVQPVSRVMTVDAFGTITPRKSVKVAVEVPGRIVFVDPGFIEGGQFEKNDLLIQIDPETYQLEKSAATVRVSQAQTDIKNFIQEIGNLKKDIELSNANLALARKELERIRQLSENKYASTNTLDRTEQMYLQAKMQLQALENRLRLTDTAMEAKEAALAMARVDFQKAELALRRTRILAPFSGFVTEKTAESGEYVNPGQILGVIYEKGKLDVDVRIPIEKRQWFNVQMNGENRPKARIMLTNTDNRQSKVWTGCVARVMAQIDAQTRTQPLTVEIDLDNMSAAFEDGLKPGAFVKCSIIGETIDNIFVVPRHLLKQQDILYTVENQQLKMKKVDVLRKYDDEIYVQSGLSPGDKIVSSPLPGAMDGMDLSVAEK